MNNKPVAELVLEQMAVGDASSLRVNWLTDSYPPVGTLLYTHPAKELRVKPEPEFVPVLHIDCLLSLAREMEYAFQNESNLEGRVWASRLIKYIREGETGELKDAEVLK